MVCIQCGSETTVINSRLQKRRNQVWRRRKCLSCGTVFSTTETAQYSTSWVVRDKDGQICPFERDKLFMSLYQSCQHRPAALTDAAALADTIIGKLHMYVKQGVIERQVIAKVSQVSLNRFDKAGSVHYQAFHRK